MQQSKVLYIQKSFVIQAQISDNSHDGIFISMLLLACDKSIDAVSWDQCSCVQRCRKYGFNLRCSVMHISYLGDM